MPIPSERQAYELSITKLDGPFPLLYKVCGVCGFQKYILSFVCLIKEHISTLPPSVLNRPLL